MASNSSLPSLDVIAANQQAFMKNMDVFFLITMGMIVYLMQAGFAFLEAGSVRSKNTSNILIKNLLDSFIAGIAYWTLGYGFAYGEGNEFIGWNNFASHEMSDVDLAGFFFQFVFAATTATIVSGALAERCEFAAYFVYSFILTAFIYPVVTHWVWTGDGWLALGEDYTINNRTVNVAYTDFAGSGVVHCCGGTAALVGAAILGPRLGRFHARTGTVLTIRGHSTPFAALGGFILVFGFMAFNGGSQLAISSEGDGGAISLAIVNTVISGSVAAMVSLIIRRTLFSNKWSLLNTLNGALTGMVAMCAGCNAMETWSAPIVGGIAGLVFNFTSWLMLKRQIDDPLDAVAVHLGGGIWGVICVAFFHRDRGIVMNFDPDRSTNGRWEESGLLLAWQTAGLVSIIAWTGVLCVIMFGILKVTGIFRVSEDMERKGLDIPKHGEPAYPLESYGHGYTEDILTLNHRGSLAVTQQGYGIGGFEGPEAQNMKHSKAFAEIQAKFAHMIPDVPEAIVEEEDETTEEKADQSNGHHNPALVDDNGNDQSEVHRF